MTFASYSATVSLLLNWYFANLFFPNEIILMKNSLPLTKSLLLWNGSLLLTSATILYLLFRWNNTLKGFALGWFIVGFAFMPPSCAIHAFSMGLVIEPYWFYFSSMGFLCSARYCCGVKTKDHPLNMANFNHYYNFYFGGIVSYRQHVIARTEMVTSILAREVSR